jgi:hypothetical protein
MLAVSFIATFMSITGYALLSRLSSTMFQQKVGLTLKLVSGILFLTYAWHLQDFSFLILTVFYFCIDSVNLYQRVKK